MKPRISNVVSFAGALLVATTASAQNYTIDWHTTDGGGGTSTGGLFSLNGTIGQPDAGSISGGGFSLIGGFWSNPAEMDPGSIVIFSNTNGSLNGLSFSTPTTWLAGKICMGSEGFTLDSVTLFPRSGDGTGKPHETSVRLQIYSDDPATGRPSASSGAIMNLSGATNPVTLVAGNAQTPLKWVPATPFNLSPDVCYWVVLSVESGANAWQEVTVATPEGAAASLGRSSSLNGGATWGPTDGGSNYKMLILATASQLSPALTISMAGAGEAVISWPFPSTGFALQQNAGLNPASWTAPSESVSDDGTNRFILVNPPTGNRIFRLLKQ